MVERSQANKLMKLSISPSNGSRPARRPRRRWVTTSQPIDLGVKWGLTGIS